MTDDNSAMPNLSTQQQSSSTTTTTNRNGRSRKSSSTTGPRKATSSNGTSISFATADSVHGQKLLIKFEYDDRVVSKLNAISGDHYCWFHNAEDPDGIFENPPAESCWHINHDSAALSELESTLGVRVPDRLWPAGSERHTDQSVELTITESGSRFRVTGGAEAARTRLYDELAYRVDNYQFTKAYKQGYWDGYERLYDRETDTAPVGLLPRALKALEDSGFTVSVEDRSSFNSDEIDTEWRFDGELRPYQHEAVSALRDRNGGILALPTGTGKTVTGLRLIHEVGERALILVHTRELLYQWADRIEQTLGVRPGIIGDGNGPDEEFYDEGPVTVATLQTLLSRGVDNLLCDYGIAIFDEAHKTSAGEEMHKLALELDVPMRVGLTATPWRRIDGEEMKIEGAVGGLTYSANASAMIQSGYIANPTFDVLDVHEGDGPNPSIPQPNEDYQSAFRRCIELDAARNKAIAREAARLAANGHRVLVNVDRVAQGRLIAGYLNDEMSMDPLEDDAVNADKPQRRDLTRDALVKHTPIAETDAAFLDSNVPDNEREELLDEFTAGDRNILISTLVEEGVDIPDISAIILAHGLKSNIETIQTIGRALRPSGEKQPRIVDIADRGNYFEDAYRVRQQTIAEYYDLNEPLDTDTAPVQAVPDSEIDTSTAATGSRGSDATQSAPNYSSTPSAADPHDSDEEDPSDSDESPGEALPNLGDSDADATEGAADPTDSADLPDLH